MDLRILEFRWAKLSRSVPCVLDDPTPAGFQRFVAALTDLQRAGLLGDPLYENTFVTNASLWQLRWWRNSRRFVLDGAVDADASLVLDGVKMGDYQATGMGMGVSFLFIFLSFT